MRQTLLLGLVWGLFCGVANSWPVGSKLAQMAVPWIWVAVFVGCRFACSVRNGARLGAVALAMANLGYFTVGVVSRALQGMAPSEGSGSFCCGRASAL
jgi:hypothetical protein